MDISSIATIAIFIVAVIAIILLIVCAAFTFVGEWKFFEKCGQKGWKALIPFYNDWTIIKISECHSWFYLFVLGEFILTLLIEYTKLFSNFNFIIEIFSVASLYIIICINYNIARKFHQGMGFAIGMCFVPFVFYLILGFSNKYKYDKGVEVNPWGIYDFKERKNVTKVVKKHCSNCGTEMSNNFCPKCGKNEKGE